MKTSWENHFKYFIKIQSAVLVPLGFGKYVHSDRVTALVPIEEERGSGRRTFVHLEGEEFPGFRPIFSVRLHNFNYL